MLITVFALMVLVILDLSVFICRLWISKLAIQFKYRNFGNLFNFIVKYILRIIVFVCNVMVVIATRCLASHYRVADQWRAQWVYIGWMNSAGTLDNHHVIFWCYALCYMPYKFNLQVFVNCLYCKICCYYTVAKDRCMRKSCLHEFFCVHFNCITYIIWFNSLIQFKVN